MVRSATSGHTQSSALEGRGSLTVRLGAALRRDAPACLGSGLELLPDKGLAHDHVRILGTPFIARIPKQSQMGLGAEDNLAYQAACFSRASQGGHAPALHAMLPPCRELPRGALIVDFVDGEPPSLPRHLPAIAQALAAIHAVPVPPAWQRAPLKDASDPLADLIEEIESQGAFLGEARLDPSARLAIENELATTRTLAVHASRPPKALIAFDAHPGNFLVRPDGTAVLVDLEKARYAYPPLDLAHATLYTSTTWDVATYAELTLADLRSFLADWARALGPEAVAWHPWIVPLRRAMWLWSITWCAKWRVLSARQRENSSAGEDWSADNSEDDLVRHVRGRVDCYLSPAIVDRVRQEFAGLDKAMPFQHTL